MVLSVLFGPVLVLFADGGTPGGRLLKTAKRPKRQAISAVFTFSPSQHPICVFSSEKKSRPPPAAHRRSNSE
jgi:hypothetical protein